MTDTKSTTRPTAREKRVRHANAQASYMERKRAEGKEWLATWVPGEAKEAFKALAKHANSDNRKPNKSYINAVEKATGTQVPEWALKNQTLLNIWLVAENDVQIDFGHKDDSGTDKPKEKEKKAKDKKKKKKK